MYETLINLSRVSKRQILLGIDTLIILASLYGAFALRFGTTYPDFVLVKAWPLFPVVTVMGVILHLLIGLSRVKLGAYELNAVFRTGVCALGLAIICSIVSMLSGLGAPRSVPIIFGFLFFVGSIYSRIAGQFFLEFLANRKTGQKRVLIYGAGEAGIQLVSALRQTREVRPVAYVDDSQGLKGLIVSGLNVYASSKIKEVIISKKIDQVILAIPSMSVQRRIELLKELDTLGCEVQALPSFLEMINGKGLIESLKPVSADDLLGRDKVDLDLEEVDRTYASKCVMVTGAGGSIGSELCRQLIL